MKARIQAEAILGRDLLPGDLFSTYGQSYWDQFDVHRAIGERVYIRTNAPSGSAPDSDAMVYRITITRDDNIKCEDGRVLEGYSEE